MKSSLRLLQRGAGLRRMLSSNPISKQANVGRPIQNTGSKMRQFSTESSNITSRYAVIDHSEAYEAAMQGQHGEQLALARQEGAGKDDLPFDPFLEEELAALEIDDQLDNDSEEYDDDVIEAEFYEGDEDDDDDDEDEIESRYNRDGSVRRGKSALLRLKLGFQQVDYLQLYRWEARNIK